MKLHVLTFLFLALALGATPAFALDLHQARASGKIGEKLDGYIAARENNAEIQALVKEINEKRRQEYARISRENNQAVDVVAKLAAQQIISGLESGAYYQGAGGEWKRR